MQLPEISRQQAIVICMLVLIALVAAGKLLAARQPTAQGRARIKLVGAVSSARSRLLVDVSGAVRRPGVYKLPTGSRVNDALLKAGGATKRADLTLVNRATPLTDGQQVLVPEKVTAATAATAASGGSTAAAPIHLNSATLEQLDELPGVGPATAQRIIDYRTANGPFKSVDELDSVSGIGPAKLAELRDLVVP
ncbi:MAG TPA: helix-hairpin-helix domain-containing protein [Gaiellaceae bacterium]|jgi:competence protein ComEA